MLEINDLNFGYTSNDTHLYVDQYKFLPYNAYGILGLNGSGKTTFFECLYQNLKYSGEILINDQKIKKSNNSYLAHHSFLYEYVLVKDFVNLIRKENNDEFIDKMIDEFKIPLNQYTQNLSFGIKRKLALVSIFALDREIYILDEPFNGIDFEAVEVLHQLINQVKSKGKIILYSSHILESFSESADFVIYINDGKFEKTFDKSEFQGIREFYRNNKRN